MCTWTDNVKFNVYSYWNEEVRQFNFTVTSFNNLSYRVLSSHILETCYKEKNIVDLYRFRVFYVTFAGDHVEVDDDEIRFNAFLRFIRESKARNDECIHLIIADTLNKNSFFREPSTKKLRFRNLDSLFRAKIDCHDSYTLDKLAGNCSANIFVRQPSFPPSQKFPSEPGLLCVRRMDGQELSRLLVEGSHVFVASGENNFLSLSFLKENEAAPYQSMCWQNRIGNFLAPEYRCEEVKIPVVLDDQANINIRNDFKNVIRFCEDNTKKPENFMKRKPMVRPQAQSIAQTQIDTEKQPEYQCEKPKIPVFTDDQANMNIRNDYKNVIRFCEDNTKKPENFMKKKPMVRPQAQPIAQTQVDTREQAQEQMACAQVEQQHHMMQHQNFMKKFHGSSRQPVGAIGNQASDMENKIPPFQAQTPAQAHFDTGAQMRAQMLALDHHLKAHHRLSQHSKPLNGTQVSNMENQKIPPLQAQAATQAEVHVQAQLAQMQRHMMQHQNHMKDYNRFIQQPITANGHQISDMENFKKNIIAEIKKEIMEDIEKKFSNNIVEKVQIQPNEQGATKNTETNGKEDFEDIMVQIEEDTVPIPKNIFRGEAFGKSMIANEPGLVESKSSNCIPEEYYDSDSSVSLIMDDSVENDRLSDGFDFVEIPRCFVTRENLDEDSSGKVSIRIKHRAPKTPKSTTSETKLSSDFENVSMPSSSSSSPIKADSEIIRERRGHEHASSFLGSHKEQEEMKAPEAAPPRDKNLSDAKTKSPDGRGSQSVNILPDKVFEMTNNVLKNVLHSVKIIPHSSEVKESVQKVLEESLKAGSRLIPNPLIPENSTTSETRAQAAQATGGTSSTEAFAPNMDNEPSKLRPNGNDTFNFDNLPEKIRANLMLLNEMGFCSNAQNLFFLKKYPDDLEKVIESLVNFTVF